jgi:hypothetical protein
MRTNWRKIWQKNVNLNVLQKAEIMITDVIVVAIEHQHKKLAIKREVKQT